VIELQPNCHAAQKQRTQQQQLIVQASIHGVINRLFFVSGQIEFFNSSSATVSFQIEACGLT
jgi:hypothetical protein